MAVDCDAFRSMIEDLLDGELATEEASELRAHAEGCEACGRALREAERVGDLVAGAVSGGASAGEMRRRVLSALPSRGGTARKRTAAKAVPQGIRPRSPRTRSRRRRRGVLFYLAAAAMIALAVRVGFRVFGTGQTSMGGMVVLGKVLDVAPEASIVRDGNTIPAEGEVIFPGDAVRSGPGIASVEVIGLARVSLAPGTELTFIGRAADDRRLELGRGEVFVETRGAKLPPVVTAHGVVRHIGTDFDVTVTSMATIVAVASGEVELRGAGEAKVEVGEGMQSLVREGAAPSEPFEADIEAVTAWARPGVEIEDPRARLLVGKMHFSCDFETVPLPEGWKVKRTDLAAYGRNGFAAAPVSLKGDKWFRAFVRGPWSKGKVRLRPESVMSFLYYATDTKFLDIRIYNDSAKNHMVHRVEPVVLGRWTRVVVRIKDLKWHEPGEPWRKGPVRPGDVFAEFKVFAGRPGEPMPEYLIDDVEIFDDEE